MTHVMLLLVPAGDLLALHERGHLGAFRRQQDKRKLGLLHQHGGMMQRLESSSSVVLSESLRGSEQGT